jgi:hypothetical protein
MRLHLSEINFNGLLTVGWIWKVDRQVNISGLQEKFRLRRPSNPALPPLRYPDPLPPWTVISGLSEMNALSANFLFDLFEDLIHYGVRDVADAFWHLTYPTWHKV